MKRLVTMLSLAALAMLAFSATAFAADVAVSDDGSLLDLARPVFDAVMHGNYWMAAALAVIFLTAAARKYAPGSAGAFMRGNVGGLLTAFVMASLGAVANALAAVGPEALNAALALTALKVGLGAVGGFVALHKLATALVASAWYKNKAPAWLQMAVALVLKLIGSSAIARAEAAGQKAVEAHPPVGASELDGATTDL